MGRYKEAEFLRLELCENICDECKRWNGYFINDDIYYDCKYNKDKKGVHSGLTERFKQNYKCKYFKRNEKYMTCRFTPKNYTSYYKDGELRFERVVRWNKGKYEIKIIKTKKESE